MRSLHADSALFALAQSAVRKYMALVAALQRTSGAHPPRVAGAGRDPNPPSLPRGPTKFWAGVEHCSPGPFFARAAQAPRLDDRNHAPSYSCGRGGAGSLTVKPAAHNGFDAGSNPARPTRLRPSLRMVPCRASLAPVPIGGARPRHHVQSGFGTGTRAARAAQVAQLDASPGARLSARSCSDPSGL